MLATAEHHFIMIQSVIRLGPASRSTQPRLTTAPRRVTAACSKLIPSWFVELSFNLLENLELNPLGVTVLPSQIRNPSQRRSPVLLAEWLGFNTFTRCFSPGGNKLPMALEYTIQSPLKISMQGA
jgi:hypothetical protein